MIDQRPDRLPAQPPTVSPPRPFVERRVSYRRTEDQIAHREKVLLARALDILASDVDGEERLAGLLRLLARTVGARHAAVIADGIERRTAVAVDPGENPGRAEALAAWLDVHAPRTRAQRAAAGRSPVSFVVGTAEEHAEIPTIGSPSGGPAPSEVAEPHYAMVPIPSAGEVFLGFEFARERDAERLADRLPSQLARHAAVALALVTAQLASERELASLRARDAERTTFVSTIAHELRTPLTGLRGYLELILGGKVGDPDVERDFMERSRGIVDSMGDLVDDLLELSRLESGTLGLEVGPFSVAEAGSQVASNLLPIAIDRGIALRTSLPPRLRVATADRRRVEQILTNLAANALKFTRSGGTVEIHGRFVGLVAVMIVRDDGPGIPKDDRDRIFERFHRMASHERITGTGLGLPIARDLARRMAGDLDVASVAGGGSSFVLVLPGPAPVEPGAIVAMLEATLLEEERALDERMVRRALAAAGREVSAAGMLRPVPDRGTRRTGEAARLRALPPVDSEDPTTA
ncbi:MAG TPA: HAMP domain-containing sensor histidine kinase [Candidatus Limnocylindrales bacterium]|nr:HAMP domain-containing sensor histidine kinase [Candidatus Limnocylindrales bacterium]